MPRPLERFTPYFPRRTVESIKREIARPISWNLDALAWFFGTDKGRRQHCYTPHYGRHLGNRRRLVRSVLEIGVGGDDRLESGGESLRMWRSYFPNAHVYGIDIYEKRFSPDGRITVLQGDQSDTSFLARVSDAYGPFDLIVDDGSHLGPDQIASFGALFPTVRPGGLYVIEDLETSYWEDWAGGPPGSGGTGVDLVKHLLDDVNIGPLPVASVHCYTGIAFVERAEVAAKKREQMPRPSCEEIIARPETLT